MLSILLAAAGCAALPSLAGPDGAADLVGSPWRLERIRSRDRAELRPREGEEYTLQFGPNRRVTGQADRNRIMGPYSVNGTRLSIGPLGSTRVAVRPGSIETEYKQALERAASFRIERNRLRIALADESGTMIFTQGATSEPAPGSSDAAAIAPVLGDWSLSRVGENAVGAGLNAPTLNFKEDGAVGGSTGVNSYGTRANLAQLAEGRLALGQITSTLRAGRPEAMRLERQFLEALQKARIWKVSGRTLYLEAGGKEVLTFRR